MTKVLALLLVVSASVISAQADSRDWSLKDMNGGTYSLTTDAAGAPTLVVFWATWCVPCKKEINDHQALLNEFVTKGVKVVLVSEDNPKSQSKIKPFIESKSYTWPVLLDPDGALLKQYGGTSIPYTVLVDKNGNSEMKIRGAISDTKALSNKVNELLGN